MNNNKLRHKGVISLIFLIIIASGCAGNYNPDSDLHDCRWGYYDGCNACNIADGKVTSCTERYCESSEYEEPECLSLIKR